jgi:hypothetical protein
MMKPESRLYWIGRDLDSRSIRESGRRNIMRTSTLTVVAVLATGLSLTASAQNTLPEINVVGKVSAPARYYMDTRDVHEVSGVYDMSDGSSLRIRDWSRKLRFDIDGRSVELYPVGRHVYSTATRDVTLAWVPDESRSVVAIMYIPTAALAQVNPKPVFKRHKSWD